MSGGSLNDYFERKKKEDYSEREICRHIYDILTALNYLHLKGIIHRDLNSEKLKFLNLDENF